jgi:ribosomal protein S6--L-glutamate ligase
LNDLDAVIPRIRPSLTDYGCALLREFESLGVYTLNSSAAISKSRDYLYSLQVLMKSGVDIPASGFANSPADVQSLIALTGGPPLVVRLLTHDKSSGVMLANSEQAAEQFIASSRTIARNLMLQEYIRDAQGLSLRVLVANGKVVASIKREAEVDGQILKARDSGHGKSVKITAKERRLAVKAVKTLGLTVAGVDIIRAERGPLLLGIGPSPSLEAVERITSRDVATRLITLIEKKLGWKPSSSSAVNQQATS